MTEVSRDIGILSSEKIRRRILHEFHRHGCLPATQQLLLRADPFFGTRRRWQVFLTTPHLRAALLALWPLHLLLPARRPRSGRSARLDAAARLGGDGNTFYFNALVLELLEILREGAPASPEEEAMEAALRADWEDDFLAYPQGSGKVKAWGYFPLKHPRFDPGKPLLALLFKWGANAADLDSSSLVLCRLLKAGSPSADPLQVLELLEDHVHGEGRYGRERLAYDNGVEADDRGILLWVQEKHNELDAGVNVNLACLLAALLGRLKGAEKERAFRLSAGLFRFLGDHIRRGSYAKGPFLMYYSLEALAFLWMRLAAYADALPEPDRGRFDPRGDCAALGAHLADLLAAEIRAGARGFNAFDRLLVLPILLRHGREVPPGWTSAGALEEGITEVTGAAYEFGKFVYPTTLLYGCRAAGMAAALVALRELEARAGKPPAA